MWNFFKEVKNIANSFYSIFEEHCKKQKPTLKGKELRDSCYLCHRSFAEGPPIYICRERAHTHEKYNISGQTDKLSKEEMNQFNVPHGEPEQQPASKKGKGLPPATKVLDHCHISGRYHGPAHAGCNLRLCMRKNIPIFFHNLSHHDSHFIL